MEDLEREGEEGLSRRYRDGERRKRVEDLEREGEEGKNERYIERWEGVGKE